MYQNALKVQAQRLSFQILSSFSRLIGRKMPEYADQYPAKKQEIREIRRAEFEKAKAFMTKQLQIELEKEKQKLVKQKTGFFDMLQK